MSRQSVLPIVAASAFLALAYAATLLVSNEYYFFAGFTILQFVVLATAWNILGGYCGYVNFGTGAFFAAGAYSAVFMSKMFDASIGTQLLVGVLAASILGLGIGYLALRFQGIYFAISTIAVATILEVCVMHWDFVGGARGTAVLRPAAAAGFTSYNRFLFFLMACLSVLAVAIARALERSWLGRGFKALRDNEVAAECMGVPTLRLKLIASTISGGLMGLAGAPQAFFVNYIDPTSAFNLNYAVSALAMPLVGGTAHWSGPVIGALLLGSVQQVLTVTISSEINLLILGALMMLFVVVAPKGLLGAFQRVLPGLRA
jgi:branched-chain amino acid transport system permease protein